MLNTELRSFLTIQNRFKKFYKDFFICELKAQKVVRLQGSEEEYEGDSLSWTPNLSHKLSRLETSRASGSSKHEIIYEKADESLRLPAKAIGTIAKIWFTTPDAEFTPEILGVFRACAPGSMAEIPYSQGGNKLDAYIYSLAGGWCKEGSQEGRYPSVAVIRKLIQGRDFSGKECMERMELFLSHIRGRAIFSTRDGLIGMCPSTGKVGDKIYATLGVHVPFLLSGVKDMPNRYRLKGACYIHGFSNSEAFLGPIPVPLSGGVWTHQMEYIQGSFEVVFRTGEVMTQSDPGLGLLPEGWKKVYIQNGDQQVHEAECNSDGTMRRLGFQHMSTGELTIYDPRMTSAVLKSRGVILEDIIII